MADDGMGDSGYGGRDSSDGIGDAGFEVGGANVGGWMLDDAGGGVLGVGEVVGNLAFRDLEFELWPAA